MLLNTDTKLLAEALVDRWGTQFCSVVGGIQTAFLPGLWIWDNILALLEEVKFLKAAREPGCITFLEFLRAYDRLTRHWLMQCMGAIGLRPSAQRWVQLLHSQLTARVRFSGWLSLEFPVDKALARGSPLSPFRHSSTASGSSPAETGSPGVVEPHQQAGRQPRSTVSSAC